MWTRCTFHLIVEGLLMCPFSGGFLYDLPFCLPYFQKFDKVMNIVARCFSSRSAKRQLVSWSLTSLLAQIRAISETKGQVWRDILMKEGYRYINLNPGCLFVQQPPKQGMGSRGSFKLFC